MPNFLTSILKENNFQVEEVTDDIVLVKDFFSKDELNQVFSIINSTPNEEWFIEYHANLKNFCLQKFGRDDVDNLVAEGKFEITQNWQDKNLNIGQHPFQKILYMWGGKTANRGSRKGCSHCLAKIHVSPILNQTFLLFCS